MLNTIKQAAIDAIQASNPVAVMFGTVTSINPLEVNVDQRFTLTEDFLVVTERVTPYETQAEFDLQHTHQYIDEWENAEEQMVSETKTTDPALGTITINVVVREGLKVGDIVLLLRMQGGQRFVIMDKVVEL